MNGRLNAGKVRSSLIGEYLPPLCNISSPNFKREIYKISQEHFLGFLGYQIFVKPKAIGGVE